MKRFTSTEKWSDPWYRKMSPVSKCFWEWICGQCDHAGSIDIDFELASFQIGSEVSVNDLAAFGDRIQKLDSGRYWVSGFIDFQYGQLSENCSAHGPVFKAISDRGIPYGVGYGVGYGVPYKVPYKVGYKVPLKIKTRIGQGQGQEKDSIASNDFNDENTTQARSIISVPEDKKEIPKQTKSAKYSASAISQIVEEWRIAMVGLDPKFTLTQEERLRSEVIVDGLLNSGPYTIGDLRAASVRAREEGLYCKSWRAIEKYVRTGIARGET